MRVDLTQTDFSEAEYRTYIYGSAEVIGLMCLCVFTAGDRAQYEKLRAGAQTLGAAYQKVNFLRDIAADVEERGRMYFPGLSIDTMTDEDKKAIIREIDADFAAARPIIEQLPPSAKRAVRASYRLYSRLLDKMKVTPMNELRRKRVSLPMYQKALLLTGSFIP
jgi:phytoene/squalene synthetase